MRMCIVVLVGLAVLALASAASDKINYDEYLQFIDKYSLKDGNEDEDEVLEEAFDEYNMGGYIPIGALRDIFPSLENKTDTELSEMFEGITHDLNNSTRSH